MIRSPSHGCAAWLLLVASCSGQPASNDPARAVSVPSAQPAAAPEPEPAPPARPAPPAEPAVPEVAEPVAPSAPARAPASAAPAAVVAGPCGENGQPHCPMQGWMEDHLQSALDKSDLSALALGLTRAATLAPDQSWNAGVVAAKQGDMAATRQACKTCHKAWRSKYKQSFRLRILPD